ncbi:MAG: hypothetical protein FWF54_04555 [Candidatus Azobacteroides sp.]|jgi:hypothetical protein|nr:hypothetical protein [Candidatus Azobacteroides sp.]
MEKAGKEQIAEWKAMYGDVYLISVDGKEAYLKQPSRKIIGYASVAGKNNPIKFNEVILNDCWLGGDEEIKTNDTLFLSVSSQLAELIQIKEAELVKL